MRHPQEAAVKMHHADRRGCSAGAGSLSPGMPLVDHKPVLIEAVLAELSFESFDAGVLHWFYGWVEHCATRCSFAHWNMACC